MPVVSRHRRRACKACGRPFGLGAVFGSGIWVATCRHCGRRSRATRVSFAICVAGLFGAVIAAPALAQYWLPQGSVLAVLGIVAGLLILAALIFSLFLTYEPVAADSPGPARKPRPAPRADPERKRSDLEPYDELATRIVRGPWGSPAQAGPDKE